MASRELKKLVSHAIVEIERRGWVKGDLAKMKIVNEEVYQRESRAGRLDGYLADDMWIDIPVESCQVCALGAMGAAYFNDPRLGMNHRDVDPDNVDDATYDRLIAELADAIEPGWEMATCYDDLEDEDIPEYTNPYEVVFGWNDAPLRTEAEVLARLREIVAS